jgi:hypothetical protein
VTPGFTNWSPSVLTVDTAYVWLPTGLTVNVAGDVVVSGAGATRLVLDSHGVLRCGGDLTFSGGADLHVYSGVTNGGSWSEYGALVQAGGTMDLGVGTWVYPFSDIYNGGSPKFIVGDLTVASGAGFNANTYGFRGGISPYGHGWGPGAGQGSSGRPGGGGYGGRGADGNPGTGGPTYGNPNAPAMPGSGAGSQSSGRDGGNGGGLIWVESSGTVTLGGTLTANGANVPTWSAGGSGGGIYVSCRTFTGSSGLLSANGGNGHEAGGGGGGRIAVWRTRDTSAGVTATVTGGGGYATGELGTIVWGDIVPSGTMFVIR